MPNQFPGGANSFPRPDETTWTDDPGFELDVLLNEHSDAIEDDEAKIGYSESSAQDTPLANTVLASLTNGKSKWTTVATAMLAANAATQVGAVTAIGLATSSTSFADATGLSVALTTVGGDLIALLLTCCRNGGAGQIITVALQLDGGTDDNQASYHVPSTDYTGAVATGAVYSPSAGSHTVKGRWKASGATSTMNFGILIVLERKR